ncbi:MAG: hypothetical protein LLG44_05485 [Chloroflexi bacterium]|nr:hypothetical protein [Chloroflexota bacterium]
MLRQHQAEIVSRVEPLVGSTLLYLRCPELAAAATPGQFVMLRLSPSADPYLRLPLPIHRLLKDGIVLFISNADWSPYLDSFVVGDKLDLLGPGGQAQNIAGYQTLALVSQGFGIAPLLSFADRTHARVVLLASVASPGQVYPRELVPKQVEYRTFVGQASEAAWRAALAELPDWAHRVFAAGGKPLYTQLRSCFEQHIIPLKPGRVYIWSADNLVCGLGACRGCAITTRHGQRLCCQDGPFMDLNYRW